MKKFSAVLITSALLLSACSHSNDNNGRSENNTKQTSQPGKSDDNQQRHTKVIRDGRTYVGGILIVNKDIGLPSDYNPDENPKAQQALQQLFSAIQKDGIQLYEMSDYRGYPTQVQLYSRYVAHGGRKAADRYSARPGYSEHQTGPTFDIGGVGSNKSLYASFGETKEGQWITKNVHKYGFIVRYPKGKGKITGYQYEPWHLRYLGKDTATKVYQSGKTLEGYIELK